VTPRQRTGVDHFQTVRVQIQEDVAALRVGAMHQRVDQQLAYHHLVESGHVLAIQAIRQFVTFAEIRDFQPDGLNQFHRVQRVVIPHQLVDLLAVLVVLDELDYWRRGQLRTLLLLSQTKDAQVSQVVTLRELIVIEQLVIGLFLDGRLDSIRCPQRIHQLAELVRGGG